MWARLLPLLVLACRLAPLLAEDGSARLPATRPVPVMQAVPLPYDQISFQRNGKELTRYHFGPQLERPFFFPILGPSGQLLTRMGHPKDPQGHSHHNSVWIAHNDVAGNNFWTDSSGARIAHQFIEQITDGMEEASVVVVNHWITSEQQTPLKETRKITVRALPNDEWMLLLDISLTAADRSTELGRTPFGFLGVRMARSIGVTEGGGRILNSEGGVNEQEVIGKRARWVDYTGAVTGELLEGITLMDHPANFNFPTYFHVRNDGWMGASFNYESAFTLAPKETLRLQYGLYVHARMLTRRDIEAKWREFAGEEARRVLTATE